MSYSFCITAIKNSLVGLISDTTRPKKVFKIWCIFCNYQTGGWRHASPQGYGFLFSHALTVRLTSLLTAIYPHLSLFFHSLFIVVSFFIHCSFIRSSFFLLPLPCLCLPYPLPLPLPLLLLSMSMPLSYCLAYAPLYGTVWACGR